MILEPSKFDRERDQSRDYPHDCCLGRYFFPLGPPCQSHRGLFEQGSVD